MGEGAGSGVGQHSQVFKGKGRPRSSSMSKTKPSKASAVADAWRGCFGCQCRRRTVCNKILPAVVQVIIVIAVWTILKSQMMPEDSDLIARAQAEAEERYVRSASEFERDHNCSMGDYMRGSVLHVDGMLSAAHVVSPDPNQKRPHFLNVDVLIRDVEEGTMVLYPVGTPVNIGSLSIAFPGEEVDTADNDSESNLLVTKGNSTEVEFEHPADAASAFDIDSIEGHLVPDDEYDAGADNPLNSLFGQQHEQPEAKPVGYEPFPSPVNSPWGQHPQLPMGPQGYPPNPGFQAPPMYPGQHAPLPLSLGALGYGHPGIGGVQYPAQFHYPGIPGVPNAPHPYGVPPTNPIGAQNPSQSRGGDGLNHNLVLTKKLDGGYSLRFKPGEGDNNQPSPFGGNMAQAARPSGPGHSLLHKFGQRSRQGSMQGRLLQTLTGQQNQAGQVGAGIQQKQEQTGPDTADNMIQRQNTQINTPIQNNPPTQVAPTGLNAQPGQVNQPIQNPQLTPTEQSDQGTQLGQASQASQQQIAVPNLGSIFSTDDSLNTTTTAAPPTGGDTTVPPPVIDTKQLLGITVSPPTGDKDKEPNVSSADVTAKSDKESTTDTTSTDAKKDTATGTSDEDSADKPPEPVSSGGDLTSSTTSGSNDKALFSDGFEERLKKYKLELLGPTKDGEGDDSSLTGQYRINNPDICKNKDVIDILYLIASKPQSMDVRVRIREGHVSPTVLEGVKMEHVFFVGLTNSPNFQKNIDSEKEKYNDIAMGEYMDSPTPENSTRKAISAWRWAKQYCPQATHVMYVDESIFVDTDKLIKGLIPSVSKLEDKHLLCPFMPAIGIPRQGKTAVQKPLFPTTTHFKPYCKSYATFMSRSAMLSLLAAAEKAPSFPASDVYLFGYLPYLVGDLGVYDAGSKRVFHDFGQEVIACYDEKKDRCPLVASKASATRYAQLMKLMTDRMKTPHVGYEGENSVWDHKNFKREL